MHKSDGWGNRRWPSWSPSNKVSAIREVGPVIDTLRSIIMTDVIVCRLWKLIQAEVE